MQPALWIAKTGLSAQDVKLATIANNLANVSTTGFKRDEATFQDLLYQTQFSPGGPSSSITALPSGLNIGTGVRIGDTKKQFTEGSINVTSQTLDVAVNGRGFLQVLMPDGTLAYTRDGSLQINSQGQLVTAQGYAIQPAITIPPQVSQITIGQDGTVSYNNPTTNLPSQIGQITLADFINPQGLQAIGNNLYMESGSSGTPVVAPGGTAGMGTLQQGALETSNVNIVTEMVDMITAQRAYEMNSKVISTADSMMQFVTQNM